MKRERYSAEQIVAALKQAELAAAIEVRKRLRTEHVVSVLSRLVVQRRAPRFQFADNGSEFSGPPLDMCAYHHKAQIAFIRPDKPTITTSSSRSKVHFGTNA